MQVFLVSSVACPLVGIEQCTAFLVLPAWRAAFFSQFAGCILGVAVGPLPIPVILYQGPPGPFLLGRRITRTNSRYIE